jgi:outer membrane receptor protein involved in Fe transport
MCIGGMPHASINAQQTIAAKPAAREAWVNDLLSRRVTVKLDRVSLEQALNTVAATAKVRVGYQLMTLEGVTTLVTLHAVQLPLSEVLDRLLRGTGLHAVPVTREQLSIEPAETGSVADGVITGRVTDANTKVAIVDVAILLDGATRGVSTGADGTFKIAGVAPGQHTLLARRVGYTKTTRTVIVQEGTTARADIAMEASASALAQVIVTGTVIPTELKAVPSAITVITAKQLQERGITQIQQLFRGDVPGLFAQNQGSYSGLDNVIMFSRGSVALSNRNDFIGTTGASPIKTYVDGVELADPKYLSQIDPKSIERIEILTGPQASTIYGSNAISGVMQIFTKRGTSNTPQLTLNLLSGWVENNFSRARTPQHDYNAQLSGVGGQLSYNAGGSWNYTGPWSPAKQTAVLSAFGAGRLELSTPVGGVTTDISLRRSTTTNFKRGGYAQGDTDFRATGYYVSLTANGVDVPTRSDLFGETTGLTFGYRPTNWWSHELGIGRDVSDSEHRYLEYGYSSLKDTTVYLLQQGSNRRSIRYNTTAVVPVGSHVRTTLTVGADAWQHLATTTSVYSPTLTGTLTNPGHDMFAYTLVARQPTHNTGGFLQTQFVVADRLFMTYGLRAEWNPNFGAAVQPAYSPRYGIAYTHDIGMVTTKLRASYGSATRPPLLGEKNGQIANDPIYGGLFDVRRANLDLRPEIRGGADGGIELYVGNRASLSVTRYNETVDDLISDVRVDSIQSVVQNPRGNCAFNPLACGYEYQGIYQHLNVGSIRNQGWELQGSLRTGPFTTRGTYSWTKSRVLGITPKYRTLFNALNFPQYQPGATFNYLPEHTWAAGVTYAHGANAVGLNLTGIGRVPMGTCEDDLCIRHLLSIIRLRQDRYRMTYIDNYMSSNPAYVLADVNASRRFSSRVDGVLHVQNAANKYVIDRDASFATAGRITKGGIRVRF